MQLCRGADHYCPLLVGQMMHYLPLTALARYKLQTQRIKAGVCVCSHSLAQTTTSAAVSVCFHGDSVCFPGDSVCTPGGVMRYRVREEGGLRNTDISESKKITFF